MKQKYKALIALLKLAKGVGVASFIVHIGSQITVNQVNGEYAAKGEQMKIYLKEVKAFLKE